MDSMCRSGESEHRLEWMSCSEGLEWYRCLNANCGEMIQRYSDVGCGL